ncbi:MAG TPA: tetratricopeptide repeat protein, partial [Phycisphaerae bacterium]|nr:tetratricopeptide repeat protein [Phycisphaerae bacterium]
MQSGCLRILAILSAVAISSAAWAGDAPAEATEVQSPRARLSAADTLRVHGDYPAAASAYEALQGEEAVAQDAVLGLFDCRMAVGAYAEAEALLKAEAQRGARSAAFALAEARLAAQLGAYDRAIERAQAALAIDPRATQARLLLCETLERVGRRDEAIEAGQWFERLVLRQLPIHADDMTAVGQGFYRYSVLTRDANLTERTRHVLTKMFQVAFQRLDPDYWPARIASADLLREKYNLEEARDDYLAVLAINTNAVAAHVGLGRIALESWNFEDVDRCVTAALAVNTNSVAAHKLRSAGYLVERRYDDAARSADAALAVNPNDLEAIGLAAAAEYARAHPEAAEALVARGEKVNACSAVLYDVIADTLSGMRRFDLAEQRYRQAIACDPTAADPRTELGMMYMQSGEEAKARAVLEGSWKLDPFNERTKNTLNLLDRLDRFARITKDNYIICYDAEHDAVTAEYFAQRLDAMFAEVCRDFDATLARPVMVEIFPSHVEFGVRVHGKPWIQTIGACTGWVIAMDAPRRGGDLPGPYNFAEVLRHEFTHTVTLAVTHNRIRHWFTEGLAVYEEHGERTYAWAAQLADAVRRGQLYTLESIDWGFMRPKTAGGRQMAYAQAEWMCEYLIATYGPEVIQRMLQLVGAGKSQPEVFAEVTGGAPEQFDAAFAAWARGQAASWGFDLTPPEDAETLRHEAEEHADDADRWARLARAELDADARDAALTAAQRSLELDDHQALALEVALRVTTSKLREAESLAARKVVADEAAALARRLLEVEPTNRFGLAALGTYHAQREEYGAALPLLRTLLEVWPLDPAPARVLADILYERGEYEAALPHYERMARDDTHDAALLRRIGDIHERAGRLSEARAAYERALDIDPLAEEPHLRLAESA